MLRRLPAASPIQRATKPASPDSSAGSSCPTRRRCSASESLSVDALSRKMSIQILGFAPATRVMSRSDPPAAASGSRPPPPRAPAPLARTFAGAGGRGGPVAGGGGGWVGGGRERLVRRRVDRDGRRAERRDEAVHEPVALRL